MSIRRSAIGALALALVVAGQAVAQDRAVTVFARGGGYNAFGELDDAGATDLKQIGFNLGGGVGVDLHRNVALRGDFTFARNELQENGVATGTRLNRFFYDGAVQLQHRTEAGLMPYVFAGGGAVTLHEVGTSDQDRTRAAGTFGAGLNYTISNSNLGIFAEGKGWVYDLSDMEGALAGIDRTQFELAWSGGVSYRFPF